MCIKCAFGLLALSEYSNQLPISTPCPGKARLRLLAQILQSQDRNIAEIEDMILDPEFAKRVYIPLRSLESLSSEPPSSSSPTHFIALMRSLNSSLPKGHAAYWSHHLESLSVQSKFLEVVTLEQQTNAWSRIMHVLPLSWTDVFMIQAS